MKLKTEPSYIGPLLIRSEFLPTGDLTNSKVACVECDLLVEIPPLQLRQRSLCPRCGHVLSYGNLARARLALPYGICAAVMLPLSLLFPFMSFARSGVENEVSLVQTAWTLYVDGSVILSGLIFSFSNLDAPFSCFTSIRSIGVLRLCQAR